MKKYYIGFAILLAACVAAVVYTAAQGGTAKTDKATDKAVEQISGKFNTYSAGGQTVPESLAAAGLKNIPSTVSYTKLSSTKYKICFDYKNASGGFDAGWTSLLAGPLGTSAPAAFDPGQSDSSYFDSYVEYSHKKGENCQTVTQSNNYYGNFYDSSGNTDLNSGAISGSSAATTDSCVSAVEPQVAGQLVVASVDTGTQTINFSADNQSVYDQGGTQISTISSKTYNSNTLFCLNDSKSDASALKAGDDVTVYLSSSTAPTLDEVQDYQ